MVTGAGDAVVAERVERLEQRQVGVERRLAEPVAAVRPAAVVQDLGQVAVQREDEIHQAAASGARRASDARR